MSKWDELTMAEKAEMMKVAVRNGITKLQDIRDKYNEFAEGGGISDEEYYSTMEKVAEDNYQKWGLGSPDEALVHALNDNTYNYRGYYDKYPQSEANADSHWTDEFKTVYHPTFSIESSYSGQESQYNPQGLYGGHWIGDKFIPAPWQLNNSFKGGGYKPSDSVKKRISTWEGAAMTGAIDPLSGKWGKNRSFEAEATSFYDALPSNIREQVLSNPELADHLFSYSYNVGAGNFKKRVVPALEKYYTGNGSPEEIANSMWATGDKKLRGLRNRRAVEKKGVVDALTPAFIQEPADNTFVFNPFAIQAENTYTRPVVVPDEDSYVTAHEVSPSEQKAQEIKERFDAINRFNTILNMLNMDTAAPTYTPDTGNPFLDAIGVLTNSNANGGKIHIKPSHRGRLTELKKRTGKSEAELYRTGSPATRKMITFARNARKWKHGLGGPLTENLFYPGGDMGVVYGQPYYSYDDNGKLILDEKGKPILNYNASPFPDVEVVGTNKNYILKADQERDRQKKIANHFLKSTPSLANIFTGLEALYKSSPFVTTAASTNPNIIAGDAPNVGIKGNPLNSTTSNLLKWLGKPLDQKPQIAASTYINSPSELEYSRMAKILQDNGVDLSRVAASDMAEIFQKRLQELLNSNLDRFTVVRPIGETGYSLADFAKGVERPVGEIQLTKDANGIIHMEDIMNYTRNSKNPYRKVQERGLNSALNIAHSIGSDGVVTGEIYLSAPKQYHVVQKFKDRIPFSNTGQHSNFNMVRDYARSAKAQEEGFIDDGMEYPATSMLDLVRAGEKTRKFLYGAPSWLLKTPTFHTPTKSVLFNPQNIDNEGRMIINWDDPFVFLKGGKIK